MNATVLDKRTIHPIFKYIAYFCIVDLLVFPYFPLLIMPYSLPVLLVAFVALGKVKAVRFYRYSVVIASLFIMLSALTAMAIGKAPEVLRDDILRVFQFLITFVYFFYFYTVAESLNSKVIKRVMLVGAAYIVLVAIGFVIDPLFLVALKQNLYTAGAYRTEDILIHMRFSYMFSDPNTAGYLFLMLVLFLLVYFKNSSMQTALLLASVVFVTILTQSIGVIISLVGAAFFILLKRLFKADVKFLTRCFFSGVGLGLLFVLLYIAFPYFTFAVSEFVDMFMGRAEANPGARRFEIWQYAITNFTPFLWGQGYTLFRTDGSLFRPHSDHIRLIYSYGVVVYFVFIVFFFRKISWSGYLFLFPALMAFSVNTLIDEQKLFGLFLVLLALADVKSRRNRNSVNSKALLSTT